MTERHPAFKIKMIARRYATPLSIAVFGFLGLSGSLMFFHVGKRFLQDMHGWLGVIFVIATAFHIWRNSHSFLSLIRQRQTHILFIAIAGIAAAILVSPEDEEDGAFDHLVDLATEQPLDKLAPLMGTNDAGLIERLRTGGVVISSADQSLKQIADQQDIPLPRLLAIVMRPCCRSSDNR